MEVSSRSVSVSPVQMKAAQWLCLARAEAHPPPCPTSRSSQRHVRAGQTLSSGHQQDWLTPAPWTPHLPTAQDPPRATSPCPSEASAGLIFSSPPCPAMSPHPWKALVYTCISMQMWHCPRPLLQHPRLFLSSQGVMEPGTENRGCTWRGWDLWEAVATYLWVMIDYGVNMRTLYNAASKDLFEPWIKKKEELRAEKHSAFMDSSAKISSGISSSFLVSTL